MPAYKPLTRNELDNIIDELYKYDKNNIQRDSFKRLYLHLKLDKMKELPENAQVAVLMAMLVFEETYIHDLDPKYKFRSPNKDEKQSYFNMWTGFGSDMYTAIKRRINKDNNPLTDTKRLAYLNTLYHYINLCVTEEDFKNFFPQINSNENSWYWKDKEALSNEVLAALVKVKGRVDEQIKKIKNATPIAKEVKANINEVSENYIQKNQTRWKILQNTTHENLAKFIKFMDKASELQSSNNRAEEIRLGAALYTALAIKDEYYILSPEGTLINSGSDLYKDCVHKILNKEQRKDIDRKDRINWLRELTTHLRYIINECPEVVLKLCNELQLDVNALKEISNQLNAELYDQEVKQNSLGWTATGINHGVKYGIGITGAALLADFTAPLVFGAAGPLGIPFVIAGETFMLYEVGQFAYNYLYNWTVDKVGTKITTKATSALDNFVHGDPGVGILFNRPELTDDDREEIVEWIMTLLTLPEQKPNWILANQLMTAEEKQQIRRALGIKNIEGVSEEQQVREIVGIHSNRNQEVMRFRPNQ